MLSHVHAPCGSASCEPLDFAELVSRCMGSQELAERILSRFEQSFGDDLTQLLEAVDACDRERVASIAHRLKGASANVSAPGLTDITGRLEHLGRSASPDEMGKCMSELQSEWNRFQQLLAVGVAD